MEYIYSENVVQNKRKVFFFCWFMHKHVLQGEVYNSRSMEASFHTSS